MPLTKKGEEILANMKKQYGKKQGESIFYASKNAGTISGVDSADEAGPPAEEHEPITAPVVSTSPQNNLNAPAPISHQVGDSLRNQNIRNREYWSRRK